MALPSDRKLYLGPRLRVLRRELGLNQTRMAEELGVSPSYLNHLERNQRPLTAQILLRLAHTYDIDVRDFVAGANEAAASDLHEIFADALVRDIGIPRHEIMEVAENYPSVAEAVTRLYGALRQLRRMPEQIDRLGDVAADAPAIVWLRAYLQGRRHHLDEIDVAAETLSAALGDGPEALHQGMIAALGDAPAIKVQVMPAAVMVQALRHYDFHRRRLMVSEQLPPSGRQFAIAYQLATRNLARPIDAALADAAPPDGEAAALARTAFTNYAAAAIVMPYARFLAAAEGSRYDLDLLCARFGVSYEQAALRLTSLGRKDAPGLPFFLVKLDSAGNVAKRIGTDDLMPPLQSGGGCPRWDVQRAFRMPGETDARLVELAPADRYATFARAIARTAAPGRTLILLGCKAADAGRVAAADMLGGAAVPIGPACAACERPDCEQRALPPVMRTLDLQPYQRPLAPYPFRPV